MQKFVLDWIVVPLFVAFHVSLFFWLLVSPSSVVSQVESFDPKVQGLDRLTWSKSPVVFLQRGDDGHISIGFTESMELLPDVMPYLEEDQLSRGVYVVKHGDYLVIGTKEQ